MDKITNGVVETNELPSNIEQLVKVNIKNGTASATLYANPNGSKLKQRVETLEGSFNNLKTITHDGITENLYGPGNITIKGGGSDGVAQAYVDAQDEKVKAFATSEANDALAKAKEYADSVIISDNGSVVLIDATRNVTDAQTAADSAFGSGKAVILKCSSTEYVPVTSSSSGVYEGVAISYGGYEILPNTIIKAKLWTLKNSTLSSVVKEVPANSCSVFDCTKASVIANVFQYANSAYSSGNAVILKVTDNRFVLASEITSTYMRGYVWSFNAGSVDGETVEVASVDIIRYTLTSSGLTTTSFNFTSGGGSGTAITITNRFSTNTVEANTLPKSPDEDPTFWNQTAQTSASVWGCQKSTGNDWYFWKILPKDGTSTEGNGIAKINIDYATSTSSSSRPASSKFTEIQPSVADGEYLWTRITITYTQSTDSTVWYTVSKIGKDGIDGKAGTAITIKGTLDSTDKLPTSGNTAGDGYIINGDLWVYTGTSGTTTTLINGFKNVGQIQGPEGKTACLHRAWCNGYPGDEFKHTEYIDFDIDALDGTKYLFLGTYVDFKDGADAECLDSTDPDDYKWVRTGGYDGEDTVSADLNNKTESIPLTYEGVVSEAITAIAYVGLWEGKDKIAIKSITVTEKPDNVSVSTAISGSGNSEYPGVITATVTKGITTIKEGSNKIKLEIVGTCRDGDETHVCEVYFDLIGTKAGENAATYKIIPSVDTIYIDKDGNYDVSSVSAYVQKTQRIGETIETALATDGYLYYSIDGGQIVATSNNYAIQTSKIGRKVDYYFSLKKYDSSVTDWVWLETEDVFVRHDSKDGETAYIQKTEYEYAVSMSFTSQYDTLYWTSEQITSAEPGQYIYIKTIRYWGTENSDEATWKTTEDYSWVRYGLNGYSNLPFVSTVFLYASVTPAAPTGGNYESPVPTGWSDGVPSSGTGSLWLSQRKFTADGLAPQDEAWSTPVLATGTTTLNIRYATTDECPKDPDTAVSGVWSSTPSTDAVWGAFQVVDGNIKHSWNLYKIKGEGAIIDTTSAATPFMGEWDSETLYYGTKLRTDIVRVTGTQSGDTQGTYYYIANRSKNFNGVTTPKPGTTSGNEYWLKFGANYDNIASGLIFGEKVITDMFTAINANISKLNVDDLVAKKVRTAESGERVIIESNKLQSYNSDGKLVATIDPAAQINNGGVVVGNTDDLSSYHIGKGTIYSKSSTASGINISYSSLLLREIEIESDLNSIVRLSNLQLSATTNVSGNPSDDLAIKVTMDVKVAIFNSGDNPNSVEPIAILYSAQSAQWMNINNNGVTLFDFSDVVCNDIPYLSNGYYEIRMLITGTPKVYSGSCTTDMSADLYIDAGILEILYDNGIVLGDSSAAFKYASENEHIFIGETYGDKRGVFDVKMGGNGLSIESNNTYITDVIGKRILLAPLNQTFDLSPTSTNIASTTIPVDLFNSYVTALSNGYPVCVTITPTLNNRFIRCNIPLNSYYRSTDGAYVQGVTTIYNNGFYHIVLNMLLLDDSTTASVIASIDAV